MAAASYLIILALITTPAWSYKSGAPASGCSILGPKHRDNNGQAIRSQADPAPYKFTLAQNAVSASEAIQIQLSATGSLDIQGFLIQAQLDGKPVGTFSADGSSGHAQTLECSAGPDTLTHTQIKDAKVKSVNFLWISSADLKGKTVKLVGTVAAGYDKFWVKGVTADIQVV